MNFLECWWSDSYKTGHKFMLPVGSQLMNSNFCPRSGKLSNVPNNGKIVSFGQQLMVRKMKRDWQVNFFDRDISEIDQFGKDITAHLMLKQPYDVTHFKELHKLGYLPLKVKAMPEGVLIPYKIPLTTIVNTKPLNNQVFDWLVNYLETISSAESWLAPTSATTSFVMRQLGLKWADKTDPDNKWFVDYQFHDFSMRGMGGKSAIVNSGLGFATSSKGSDVLPVIPAARMYYDEVDVCINSVIATEHAIMCTLTGFYLKNLDGDWEHIGKLEVETFRYLLKLFPSGILSIVSDTWDLWRVLTEYMVILKEEILARNGKLVIRPDSGDPVKIVTGWMDEETYGNDHGDLFKTMTRNHSNSLEPELSNPLSEPERKGVIEILYEVFGGELSSTGFIKLNTKVGAIYGDSITYKRAEQIFERLAEKRFASTNIVLGVGSYSLQYVTRDTHGMAQKATYVEVDVDGKLEGIEIFKDPVTDDGVKKSARGLLYVGRNDEGEIILNDNVPWDIEAKGMLQVIFEDGELKNQTTLTKVRESLRKEEEKLQLKTA